LDLLPLTIFFREDTLNLMVIACALRASISAGFTSRNKTSFVPKVKAGMPVPLPLHLSFARHVIAAAGALGGIRETLNEEKY
jgi:hypothetical protein